MKKILPIIVILAFVIGAFLRVWRLGGVPISLFGDEIDVGLQANSILMTGKDYLGNSFPVLFHSFAEYRLPMQLYMDVPFVKLFGLNEVGVRTPAVLMGFLTIISFYILIKELFGKKLAIISALFLTFSPWHFNYSRQANDAGILLPFIILGTYFFIKSGKKYLFLILSAVFFSLSIYTYAISSLFVPLYVLALVFIFRREIFAYGIKKLLLAGIVTLLILSPYLYQTFKGRTTHRISVITVAPTGEIISLVETERTLAKGFSGRLFYNKATEVTTLIVNNYIQAFSSTFLFVQGDPNPRNAVDEFGEMYHIDFLLVITGALLIAQEILRESNRKQILVMATWLAIAPLPSSLTQGGGMHASRLVLMLPPLIFLSARGFDGLTRLARPTFRYVFVSLATILLVFEAAMFLNRFFVIWSQKNWRSWQYGFRETLQFVKSIDGSYQRVYLNSTYEPMLPRFLFWYGYDMKLFHEQFERDTFVANVAPGFNGFKLGSKYYFGDINKPIENLGAHGDLIVASAEKDATDPNIFNQGKLNLIKRVEAPDGTPIFYVYTKN